MLTVVSITRNDLLLGVGSGGQWADSDSDYGLG